MATYCKGKLELVEGKGALLQVNGGTCKINGALFLCEKGHFSGT